MPSPVPTNTPPRPLSVQVIPQPLRQGVRVTLVALGFERDEPVAFFFTRPDGTRTTEGEATADRNGNAAYQLDVTEDWEPGEYVAHVVSRKNSARQAQRVVRLGQR